MTEPSAKSKILIVDDVPGNIHVLIEILSFDHDISVATNGEEALQSMTVSKPDLILLDIEMPGMDGFEVCKKVKRDPATCDIPIIFVTAYVATIDETRGLELGADDYVTKPISFPILKARINNHLRQYQAKKTIDALYRRNQLILDSVGEGICGLDPEGKITFINPAGVAMTGWRVDELLGQSLHPLLDHTRSDGSPYPWEESPIHAALNKGGMPRVGDDMFWRKDGSGFPVHYSVTPIMDQGMVNAVVVFQDITQELAIRRRELNAHSSRIAITALLETGVVCMPMEDQLRIALEIILTVHWLSLEYKGSIFLVEKDGRLAMKAQVGLVPVQINRCAHIALGYCLCGRAAQQQEVVFAATRKNEEDGTCYTDTPPHGHYSVPILFGKRLLGVVNLHVLHGHTRNPDDETFLTTVSFTLANLIEQRNNEERLRHTAGHDALTGLPNRALFLVRLNEHLAMATRSNRAIALMFLDLDRFKQVNDTMGHKAGDELLKEATKRILSCLRQYDVVARLGGDEFTIVLPQMTDMYYTEYVALRILEELAVPFHLQEGEANISGSIGITLFPQDAGDVETLLKNADAAMYHAKNAGRNAFCFFTEKMQSAAMERLHLEEALRAALENQEFVLHYQPILEVASQRITGVEVLVRWSRPNGAGNDLLAPIQFIPLAEEIGLIIPLGIWILRSACQQNKRWLDANAVGIRVSVNLSNRQFRQGPRLIDTVTSILAETGLPPELLELEITESMIMDDVEQAVATMQALQGLGVRISLDDFGTGYSSLGVLQRFPLHALKIDGSFIANLPADDEKVAIVSAIIFMAHCMNLTVIAEGVESVEEFACLKEKGCDAIQGFHVSYPLSADACTAFLHHHHISLKQ